MGRPCRGRGATADTRARRKKRLNANRNASSSATTISKEFVRVHGQFAGIGEVANAASEFSSKRRLVPMVTDSTDQSVNTEAHDLIEGQPNSSKKQIYNRERYRNASPDSHRRWIERSANRVSRNYDENYKERHRTAYWKKSGDIRQSYIGANGRRVNDRYRSMSPVSRKLHNIEAGRRVDRVRQRDITSKCYHKVSLPVRHARERAKYQKRKNVRTATSASKFSFPCARNAPVWLYSKFSTLPDAFGIVDRIDQCHKSSDDWLHFFWSVVHRLETSWSRRNGFASVLPKKQRLKVAADRVTSFLKHIAGASQYVLAEAEKLRKLFLCAEAATSHESDDNKETQLREMYGGRRYHVKSSEESQFDSTSVRYYPLARFEFKKSMEPSLIQLPGSNDSDDDLEMDTNLKASETTHIYRLCGSTCEMPQMWASRFHGILGTLRPQNILDCVKFFKVFESCVACKHKKCIGSDSCTDFISVLLRVRPHFCGARTLLRRLYLLRQKLSIIADADVALIEAVWENFSVVYRRFVPPKPIDHVSDSVLCTKDLELLNEQKIMEKYGPLFDLFDARFDDHPVNPCIVCRRLHSKSDLKSLSSDFVFKKDAALAMWERIKHSFLEKQVTFPIQICKNCHFAVSTGQIPRFSSLNEMDISDNSIFKNMNVMELTLIKLVKMFHEVYKLKNVSGGNWGKQPVGIRGLGYHLPLPDGTISETLNRYQMPNLDHLTILVECQPTKKKILYRYVADLSKNVLPVLRTLKRDNWLYKDIDILTDVDLNNVVAEVEEDNDDEEETSRVEVGTCLQERVDSTSPISGNCREPQECTPRALPAASPHVREATVDPVTEDISLLTMMNASEVLPGHSVCRIDYEAPNESSVDMYKMGRVQATPLFESEKHLDVKSFVHLYKDGKFGFDWPRPRKLPFSDFIKARMEHEDPRFRRDKEYIFHGAQFKDMAALRSGVYTTLKVGTFRGLTAADLRNRVENEDPELAKNLYGLLYAVPGTKEYNYQRFSDFNAMDEAFDDAIWFFTASCNDYGWLDCLEFVKNRNPDLISLSDEEILLKDQGSVCVFFHRKWTIFREEIICQPDGPLGHVVHWAYRIEYQARGPPHVHAKFWVKDAPRVGVNEDKEVLEWITSKISCHIPPEPGPLRDAVLKFQMHKCTRSCLQKKFSRGKFYTSCRYAYPQTISKTGFVNSTEEIARSRCPSRRPKRLITLPRLKGEEYVNPYCPAILLKWWGNMDVQYCASRGMNINYYISIYMGKVEKTLLQSAFNQVFESTNKSVVSKLYTVGRSQFKNRERGEHEAFDRCCGVPIFKTSVPVRYFTTAIKSNRKRRLKPPKDLEGLADDSTEIYFNNFVEDCYPRRPKVDEFENMCLQDFCCHYEIVKKPGLKQSTNEREYEMMDGYGYARRRNQPIVFKTGDYRTVVTDTQRESYFHSMLQRFIPYRNEDELLEGFRTYEESFKAKKDKFERMASAHHRMRLLRRALDLSKELQHVGEEESRRDDGNWQTGQLIPQDSIPLAPVSEQEVLKLIECLNLQQKRAFEKVQQALVHQHLHSERKCECSDVSPLLLFISGFGGTGKSHCIKAMTTWSQSEFGGENGCEKVTAYVGAPTGLAAVNVSGFTLHRLFKLPVQKENKFVDYKQLNSDEVKLLRAMFKDVRLLIIDEISMVASIMLYFIDARLREIFAKPDLLFGGLNVVVLGDLLQLRPVNSNFVFEKISTAVMRSVFGCIHAFQLWDHFDYVELTENMRQKDDPVWASLLSRARVGELTIEDEELLQERLLAVGPHGNVGIRSDLGPFAPECTIEQASKYFVDVIQKNDPSAVSLFSQNETCSLFNDYCLQHKGITNPISIRCVDVGGFRIHGKRTKNQNVKASDAGGLEEELKVGVGARIMLRRNISQEKNLVNGSLGYVERINVHTGRNGKEIVSSIDVRFDNHGQLERITKVAAEFNCASYRGRTRHQFPLCLAYAMTIHKCQGLTLSSALLDIGPDCFEEGMGYVALSRCRKMEQVYLFRFSHRHVWCDGKAVKEYNRLRKTFAPELPMLTKYNSRGTGRKRKTIVRTLALEAQADAKRRRVDIGSAACEQSSDVSISNVSNSSRLRQMDLDSGSSSTKTASSKRGTVFPFLTFKQENNSCFADSSLHAIFSMRDIFDGYPLRQGNAFDEEICRLYKLWRTPAATESSMKIREEVANRFGAQFISGAQCDAFEFTVNMLQLLNPAVTGQFTITQRCFVACRQCNIRTELASQVSDFIFPPVDPSMRQITFRDFIHSGQSVMRTCHDCELQQPHQSWFEYVFPPSSQYVLLHIPKFALQTLISTKITGLTPNNQCIGDKRFKLIAAVQHRGNSFDSGHYITWIRGGQSNKQWFLIDGLQRRICLQRSFQRCLTSIIMLVFQRL